MRLYLLGQSISVFILSFLPLTNLLPFLPNWARLASDTSPFGSECDEPATDPPPPAITSGVCTQSLIKFKFQRTLINDKPWTWLHKCHHFRHNILCPVGRLPFVQRKFEFHHLLPIQIRRLIRHHARPSWLFLPSLWKVVLVLWINNVLGINYHGLFKLKFSRNCSIEATFKPLG